MKEQLAIAQDDVVALSHAKRLLENPGFAARIADAVGTPVEKLLHALPEAAATSIEKVTKTALDKAMKVALATLDGSSGHETANLWHKIAVGASGAAGGALGLAALAIELPVSTAIMLRSVADIARSKGEDLRTPEAALACIEVFALGAGSKDHNGTESAYYAARIAVAKAVGEAAAYLTEQVAVEGAAPPVARLVTVIAQRFSVTVTEKAAAVLLPVLGAAGGAVVNLAFMDHFQDMAEGHFTVRALGRKYGEDTVRDAYLKLPK